MVKLDSSKGCEGESIVPSVKDFWSVTYHTHYTWRGCEHARASSGLARTFRGGNVMSLTLDLMVFPKTGARCVGDSIRL